MHEYNSQHEECIVIKTFFLSLNSCNTTILNQLIFTVYNDNDNDNDNEIILLRHKKIKIML